MTRLQQVAYGAQLAAALPVSQLAADVLRTDAGAITIQDCGTYIRSVQQTAWFRAAFPSHTAPVTVTGGRGTSRADATQRHVKIGTDDRGSVSRCELACLHELAHIVSSDYGPGNILREPRLGRGSSKGHHHAWRFNFVTIIRGVLGTQAATRLRQEFNQWGLPTRP